MSVPKEETTKSLSKPCLPSLARLFIVSIKLFESVRPRLGVCVYFVVQGGEVAWDEGGAGTGKNLHDEEDFREKSWFYYLGEKSPREGSEAGVGGGEGASVLIEKESQGDSGVSFAAAAMADAVLYCVDMIQFDEKYIEAVRWGVGRLAKMLGIRNLDGFSDIVESTGTQLRFLGTVLGKYA